MSATKTLLHTASNPHRKAWHALMFVQIVAFAAVGCYATCVQRHLYGDGAYFFLILVKRRAVVDFDFARYYSHFLTQFPAVILLQHFECRDIGLVSAVYGATLNLMPLVGLLLTWWAARTARADYLVYPLVASSILFLDVSFFSISESIVAVSLFFPLWPDRKRGWVLMCIVTFGCGLFAALLPPVMAIVMPPLQYVARVQSIYVPLVLGLIVVWKTMVATVNAPCAPVRQIELWRLAAGACVVAIVFQWGATTRWDEYRSAFLHDLIEHRGVIAFDQSAIYDPICERTFGPELRSAILEEIARNPIRTLKRMQFAQFNTGWGISSLSLSLSALNLGSISSIVCAPESAGWQPFDPRKPESIPDLAEFGIPNELERD